MKIGNHVPFDEQYGRLGKHNWSIPRLAMLSRDFEVLEIPLGHLSIYHKYEDLSLRDMVKHMRAVNDANLDYPIILDEDGEIIDGRHRIMKCLLNDIKTIKAVRFDENPTPCFLSED